MRSLAASVFCAFFILCSLPAQAIAYRVTNLGPALPQDTAFDINEAGQIAGTILTAPGFGQAGLWSAGSWTVLEPGVPSSAHGLNDLGQVVGSAGSARERVPTVWTQGLARRLELPSSGLGVALDINNAGQVAGAISYSDAGRDYAAAWDSQGRLLGGAAWTVGMGEARRINERGQIAGTVSVRPRRYATRWNGGRATRLTDESTASRALGINNAGTVVGVTNEGADAGATIWSAEGTFHLGGNAVFYDINDAGAIVGSAAYPDSDARYAMLFLDGATLDLNSMIVGERDGLGELVWASAINDSGQIVGMARLAGAGQPGGAIHGFLLTPAPIPEPGAWAMLLAGLGVLAARARRQRSTAEATPPSHPNPFTDRSVHLENVMTQATSSLTLKHGMPLRRLRRALPGLFLCCALPALVQAQAPAPAPTPPAVLDKADPDDTPARRKAAALKRLNDSAGVVRTMAATPRMPELLAQARGIYIVPTYARAAVGLGAAGGSGVLLYKRDDGGWSNPAFFNIAGVSLGVQAGAEGGAVAFLLMNQKALDNFRNRNNFSLSADAGITVVNFARMAQGSTAGDVVAWSGNKGLFGNVVAVSVSDIRFNARLTDAYYGKPTTVVQALDNTEARPEVETLRQELQRAAGARGAQ